MASEQRSRERAADHAGTTPDDEAPWADLEMAVPTDRDHASVVALVECSLVELTHETVGAVFVAHQVGRSTRTQYVAADEVGEQFQKRHFDDRLGWHETELHRTAVRDELIVRLSSSQSPAPNSESIAGDDQLERFYLTPVRELQHPTKR